VRSRPRILITAGVTVAAVLASLYSIAPVALSFYAAKEAPAVASVVPVDLQDKSISIAPGSKLAYLGYEFEVPWTDLDETKTTLYPKEKADKFRVDLRFRSGLRLVISAIPPRSWANQLSSELTASPQNLESVFGRETMSSDYRFVKTLYEFTPDKMNHWSALQGARSRQELLLVMKSLALPKEAETGIFNLRNSDFRGFQEGNPRVRQSKILVDLYSYSDQGGVELMFVQDDYQSAKGVTQAEINRVVETLRKAPANELPEPKMAQERTEQKALGQKVLGQKASGLSQSETQHRAAVVPVRTANREPR